MKNLRKLLPLFALVLGIGLVFTQSAFKSTTTTEYGYDPNNSTGLAVNGWVDLTLLVEDNGSQTPGTYGCDVSAEVCKGLFETIPNEESIPVGPEGTFVIY